MAYWVGTNRMNSSAPNLTISDTHLAIWDSCLLLISLLMNSRCMLRVYRFAAAIDMIAAGTSAPMPIAANATPTNQGGKLCSSSAGTAKLLPNCLKPAAYSGRLATPAAMAKKPGEQAEHQGIAGQHRRIAADGVAAAGAENSRHRVRIKEQCQDGTERQSGVSAIGACGVGPRRDQQQLLRRHRGE